MVGLYLTMLIAETWSLDKSVVKFVGYVTRHLIGPFGGDAALACTTNRSAARAK